MENRIKNLFSILRSANKADKEEKSKEQKMLEELCKIRGFTRGTIWEIHSSMFEPEKAKCEIIAGVPLDRDEHGFEKIYSLRTHDDLQYVFEIKNTYVEENPKTSNLTKYFDTSSKNISEILYVPLFLKEPDNKIVNILVVDVIGDREFTDVEIEFCELVGELISIIIIEREDSIQKTRHEIYQQIVAMEGGLKYLQRYGMKMIEYASTIVHNLEKFPGIDAGLLNKFVEHGYKMMTNANNFLEAFEGIKKKIPEKKNHLIGKES